METIIDVIRTLKGLVHMQGASQEAIQEAETKLQLTFAPDYKLYLIQYGVISANGIELTGIINSPRLSVVEATHRARTEDHLPANFYVIEELSIERCIVVQNPQGEVFRYTPSAGLYRVADNLTGYIQHVVRHD